MSGYHCIPGKPRGTRKQSVSAPDGFKGCPHCKQIKPKTTEYFKPRKDTKDGFESWCRDCCRKENVNALRKKGVPAAKRNVPIDGKLQCIGCGQLLPATTDYFYASNGRKWFNARCKACVKIQSRAYRSAHPCEGEARIVTWCKNNPEKAKAASRNYRKSHLDKVKVATARYRAKRKSLPSEYTDKDWQHALTYFNHRCAVCGRPVGLWHTLAQDHWIPLISPDCPGTIPTNIVPLCHGIDGCNNKKHDRNAEQWLIEKFGSRKARKIMKRIGEFFSSL